MRCYIHVESFTSTHTHTSCPQISILFSMYHRNGYEMPDMDPLRFTRAFAEPPLSSSKGKRASEPAPWFTNYPNDSRTSPIFGRRRNRISDVVLKLEKIRHRRRRTRATKPRVLTSWAAPEGVVWWASVITSSIKNDSSMHWRPEILNTFCTHELHFCIT